MRWVRKSARRSKAKRSRISDVAERELGARVNTKHYTPRELTDGTSAWVASRHARPHAHALRCAADSCYRLGAQTARCRDAASDCERLRCGLRQGKRSTLQGLGEAAPRRPQAGLVAGTRRGAGRRGDRGTAAQSGGGRSAAASGGRGAAAEGSAARGAAAKGGGQQRLGRAGKTPRAEQRRGRRRCRRRRGRRAASGGDASEAPRAAASGWWRAAGALSCLRR